jgi:hypothetical protein
MTQQYEFTKQKAKGQQFEAFLDKYFSARFDIRRATWDQQHQGIDRIFTLRDTKKTFSVEYKADSMACRTHNAFVETVSVDTQNIPGWAHTSKAAKLMYYVPGVEVIYVIPFSRLRAQLSRWAEEYPLKWAQNKGYRTAGLLVDLDEFEKVAEAVISV